MTIQSTLRPINGQKVAASGTTARTATAFENNDIGIYCATDCYIKFGDSTVTATTTDGGYDMLVAAGSRQDVRNGGASHVAVILASGSDTVYINEWTKKVV